MLFFNKIIFFQFNNIFSVIKWVWGCQRISTCVY